MCIIDSALFIYAMRIKSIDLILGSCDHLVIVGDHDAESVTNGLVVFFHGSLVVSNRHLRDVLLAKQDLCRHLTGLVADVIVADRQSGETATLTFDKIDYASVAEDNKKLKIFETDSVGNILTVDNSDFVMQFSDVSYDPEVEPTMPSATTHARSDSIAARIAIVKASGRSAFMFSAVNSGIAKGGSPLLMLGYRSPIVTIFTGRSLYAATQPGVEQGIRNL